MAENTPCCVRRVVVRGNKQTHASVIRAELSALKDARTLGEIGEVCINASANLRGLGIFESADMLCDAAPGTPVRVSGPTGKVMLMPEVAPGADLIMVATGTGIAPYRGFLRRLFVERTPAAAAFSGLAWLFLGVANTDALLYDADWQAIAAREPERFRVSYAISREQQRADGGKMYVQDRMAEHAEELFERLDNGAHIYFCGLKGMMPGILATLEKVAEQRGVAWEEMLATLKENGQWHVEVY